MPIVSKAQNAAMHAAMAGKSTLGIPQSVGAEFVKAGPAKEKLPQYATPKANRRDYAKGGPVKRYLWGGTVAPGKGPIEQIGHWGPQSTSVSFGFGKDMGSGGEE